MVDILKMSMRGSLSSKIGFLARHPRKQKKIADISALFEDDALVWYLDLRTKFPRSPSWEEFKTELRVKFAESPVRMSYIRKTLRNIPYGGPTEMEQYISQFRSIEIQISDNEMKLRDKLEAFILPFGKSFQRRIKGEHPRQMEVAYDAALDWASV